MTVKLTLLVSVVPQFASNNSALRNSDEELASGMPPPAIPYGEGGRVCANEIVFKTKRKGGGRRQQKKYLERWCFR